MLNSKRTDVKLLLLESKYVKVVIELRGEKKGEGEY